MTRKALGILMLLGLVTACSEPVEDRRMVNERFFGTVVTVNRVRDVNWSAAGNNALSGAEKAASRGASGLAYAADSRLGTAGMLGSVASALSNPFSASSTSTGNIAEQYLTYVIETEEGRRVNVIASDRRVYYPGDEVLVVRNQRGYSEVFPRDLSGRYPGGL